MRLNTIAALMALAGICSVGVAAELAEDPEAIRLRTGTGDPVAGKAKSESELCQGCHGEEGVSNVVGVPNLAAQFAPYLIKQLSDFRTQSRRHRIMNAMAEGLAETDLPDLAAYFASCSRPKEDGAGGSDANAKDLFLYGDVERNLEACASCHESDARGRVSRGVAYPALAGQQSGYLRVQLLNWKAGIRSNSPQGVMNRVAGQLTEAEISELANYLSGL